MPTDDAIERRLAAIEAAVAEIQRKLAEPKPPAGWLERIKGSFNDEPAFEDLVKYGREFRMADRPTEPEE